MSLESLVSRVNHLELQSPYGYTPSLAPSMAYLVVFSVLTLVHVILGIRYKYWVVFVTLVPGGILEIVGWAGRLWSHYKVLNSNPFIMQICTLILGPAFFSAWAYTLLGYCITFLGPAFSLLKPKFYLLVFVIADIVSLVLQAIGGGGAAVKAQNGEDTGKSTKIMLAGILFQLGTMTIFVALAIDFIVRVIIRRPWSIRLRRHQLSAAPVDDGATADPTLGADSNTPFDTSAHLRRVEFLLAGVAFASLMIYVRGVYRSIELAQGWTGHLITHEPFFTWLDGLPMVLCLAAFAVAHPGFLLPRRKGWKNA
ncbi:RTA1 like protein-domain-containing protein [Papiliotrema laurentii]|uniref:RTA1 like protein-domain-containing protein n=1 Tax=Papiliotrema laurentii TaxID=5418 RepID=A0AAD9CS03_PAPLA|nr:RTA1 like protein-domain-containing protein [Papiliotrema laurentii]